MPLETPAAPPTPIAGRLGGHTKLFIAAAALLVAGGVGWLFWNATREEEHLTLWDQYAEVQREYRPEERFFSASDPLMEETTQKYLTALEGFLTEVEKHGSGDALEPLTRWRIVAALGEDLLQRQDDLDALERSERADRALRHLQAIRERFPDFPLNWGQAFAPQGYANQTRRLEAWFRENAGWEREHLPKDVAPAPGVVVVLRTERGDLRLGLYAPQAPKATARFVRDVEAGYYDGTSFFERDEERSRGETRWQTLRAGDGRVRNVKPYDKQAHLDFTKPDEVEPFLPDESRNLVRHRRGVVSAWHESQDPYDHPHQLLFVTHDSPGLDYEHTPIGRLLDDASLATLDRIDGASTWHADPLVVHDTGELNALQKILQAPVAIVKALAYKDGALLTGDAPPLPTKVAPDESEKSLAGLKPDAYKKDAPAPPQPAPAPAPAPGSGTPGSAPAPAPAPETPSPTPPATPTQPK